MWPAWHKRQVSWSGCRRWRECPVLRAPLPRQSASFERRAFRPELQVDERTRDLERLLRRFDEEMDRFRLADRTAVLRLAGMAVAKSAVAVPPASLWLDLPLRSASQAELLQKLAGRSGEVLATAAAGDDEALEWLGSVLDDGMVIDLDREEPADGGASAGRRLDRVQRFVFETGADVSPASAPADESVDLFSAAGEGQECVEIARRIHRAAAAGLPFDRIAILVRQPAAYLPLVEDALGRAGIPAYITRGTLRPNPAGRAFLSLLACAGERLSATRFAEYLSLGQTPEPAAGGARLVGGQHRRAGQKSAGPDGDDAAQEAAPGYGIFDNPVEIGFFRPRIVKFVEPIEREFCGFQRLPTGIPAIGHSCPLLRKYGGGLRLDRRPGASVCQSRNRSAIEN